MLDEWASLFLVLYNVRYIQQLEIRKVHTCVCGGGGTTCRVSVNVYVDEIHYSTCSMPK